MQGLIRTNAVLLCFIVAGIGSTTRVLAGSPPPVVGLQEVAHGFDTLVGISHTGDQRLFLVEKDFGILILVNGQVLPEPFLDVSSIIGGGVFGLGGILSMAFHPDYDTNGYFFIFYSDLSNQSVIARYEVSLNLKITSGGTRK